MLFYLLHIALWLRVCAVAPWLMQAYFLFLKLTAVNFNNSLTLFLPLCIFSTGLFSCWRNLSPWTPLIPPVWSVRKTHNFTLLNTVQGHPKKARSSNSAFLHSARVCGLLHEIACMGVSRKVLGQPQTLCFLAVCYSGNLSYSQQRLKEKQNTFHVQVPLEWGGASSVTSLEQALPMGHGGTCFVLHFQVYC